jgi:hypothetical protein
MRIHLRPIYPVVLIILFMFCSCKQGDEGQGALAPGLSIESLSQNFLNPPDHARPWVYWINMDGHFDMEGITADLESIRDAGLGGVLFMEVDLGIPRGDVHYMSTEWQNHLKHAMKECERLGLEFSLITGPGWTGTGGPWMKAEESMQHLLTSSVDVKGPVQFNQVLPVPDLQISRFHLQQTPQTREAIDTWMEDVALFAFPLCEASIEDISEKALFNRDPYTSMVGVKPYLPLSAHYPASEHDNTIEPGTVIDLTGKLDEQGRLIWDVPEGEWTILRMVSRSTGAISRPAPLAGVGLESNKFDTTALNHHFEAYVGKLMDLMGTRNRKKIPLTGWNTLQFESWEMSSQNWSKNFRDEFQKRRGYDLWNYLPVLSGRVVGSPELSERFLWDLRQTSQDLIIAYHLEHLKEKAHQNGMELHIEPHDMNPTTDMVLASVGDVPMAEFWRNHFNSAFSCHQASSTGHIYDKSIVAAEAYTSFMTCWELYPYEMKNQGDWAFSTGINRFVYVRFTHQPWKDLKPGMAFGPHGIHWDRTQTFWPLLMDYHKYVSRCQYMLRQGDFVADICYLLPEGAPNVFVPPPSAFTGDKWTPDRRGYNFDACPPSALMEMAEVDDGKIIFPGGASYHLLVLPDVETMTPELLEKVESLVRAGATVVGSPPEKSPSLSGYPECDTSIKILVKKLWGGLDIPDHPTSRSYGEGSIYWGGALSQSDAANYARNPSLEMSAKEQNTDYSEGLSGHDGTRPGTPYPEYDPTAAVLKEMGVKENFTSTQPLRYAQLQQEERDIFFVANRTDQYVKGECIFRSTRGTPQLWDPVTGEIRPLPEYEKDSETSTLAMQFEAFQSFFVVFSEEEKSSEGDDRLSNFPTPVALMELEGPWKVSFDPQWGGPEEVRFEELEDWTKREEEGIRYYSGIATYRQAFHLEAEQLEETGKIYLHLGEVHDMARVILNGVELGCIWTAPWHIDVTKAIKTGDNLLEIQVANRWPNRLIGDEFKRYDGIKDGEFPEWLVGDETRNSGRYTYTTLDCYTRESPLLPSGLLGPVLLETTE